jgi:hypothetical protein
MDYPKEHKNQRGTGFGSTIGEPLQVIWNRRIKINLYEFIPKSMDLSQQYKDFGRW